MQKICANRSFETCKQTKSVSFGKTFQMRSTLYAKELKRVDEWHVGKNSLSVRELWSLLTTNGCIYFKWRRIAAVRVNG